MKVLCLTGLEFTHDLIFHRIYAGITLDYNFSIRILEMYLCFGNLQSNFIKYITDGSLFICFLIYHFLQRLPIPSTCPSPFSKLMQQCWKTDPKVRFFCFIHLLIVFALSSFPNLIFTLKERPSFKEILPLIENMDCNGQ